MDIGALLGVPGPLVTPMSIQFDVLIQCLLKRSKNLLTLSWICYAFGAEELLRGRYFLVLAPPHSGFLGALSSPPCGDVESIGTGFS